MKYTNEDFVRTISAVEDQGGELLDETCAKDEITYEIEGKTKIEHTHGCENETLFEIPYDSGATVMVPTPELEPDPKRGTYLDLAGNECHVTRAVTTEDPETGEERVVFEMVEHEGDASAYPEAVKVCAVADNVGMWPRFAGTIRDKGSK
jgi:hypothetical protein